MIVFSYVFIKDLVAQFNPRLFEFYENNRKSKYFNRSLTEIVKDITDAQIVMPQKASPDVQGLQNVTVSCLKEIYNKKMHNYFVKKRRYLKKCRDMADSGEIEHDGDKYFMWKTRALYNLTSEEARQITFNGKTLKELEADKLQEIEAWVASDKSLMTEYPGEEKLTSNSIVSNFELDVVIEVLRIIKRDYDFDLNRATYAVIENMANQPLFSPVTSKVTKGDTIEVEGSRGLVINKTEDGQKQMLLEIPDKFLDQKKKLAVWDDKTKRILSYLVLIWDEKPSNVTFATVKIKDLIRAVNGKDASTDLRVRERFVNQISQMYEFGIRELNEKNKTNRRYRIISGFQIIGNMEYVQYSIDPFYLDDLNHIRIRKMPSAPLDALETKVARILYAPFMEQRREAYKKSIEMHMESSPHYIMPFDYSYFMYWCNFGKMTKTEYEKTIIAALDDFKQNGIMVANYKNYPAQKKVIIWFYVLTEEEIKDFDFYYNKNQLPEKEDELDMEQLNMIFPTIEEK